MSPLHRNASMQHIAALKLKNPGDNSFRVQSQIIKDALLRDPQKHRFVHLGTMGISPFLAGEHVCVRDYYPLFSLFFACSTVHVCTGRLGTLQHELYRTIVFDHSGTS